LPFIIETEDEKVPQIVIFNDYNRIKSIFTYFISNALKYTFSGYVKMKIGIKETSK